MHGHEDRACLHVEVWFVPFFHSISFITTAVFGGQTIIAQASLNVPDWLACHPFLRVCHGPKQRNFTLGMVLENC